MPRFVSITDYLAVTNITCRCFHSRCSIIDRAGNVITHRSFITPVKRKRDVPRVRLHITRLVSLSIIGAESSSYSAFSLVGVGASSFQYPRSPVLCIFYLYSCLLHFFSYNISPPEFRSYYISVSTHFHLPCYHY